MWFPWMMTSCLYRYFLTEHIRKILSVVSITKTRLFKYIENFTSKNWKFSDKKIWYFSYFCSKNIDCGYSLEPPRRGGSNEYPQSMFLSRNKKNNAYPFKPQFYYIKVGFSGVKIILVCFRDAKDMFQRCGLYLNNFENNAFWTWTILKKKKCLCWGFTAQSN